MADIRGILYGGYFTGDIRGLGFGVKTDNDKYVIVPDLSAVKKTRETSVTQSGNQLNQVLISRTYEILAPFEGPFAKKIFAVINTEALNTVAANPNDKYVTKLTLLINNEEVASVQSPEHAPNNTTAQPYEDFLALDAKIDEVDRGDVIKLKVDVVITSVDPTNPGLQVTLHTDPLTSGKELIFYFQ